MRLMPLGSFEKFGEIIVNTVMIGTDLSFFDDISLFVSQIDRNLAFVQVDTKVQHGGLRRLEDFVNPTLAYERPFCFLDGLLSFLNIIGSELLDGGVEVGFDGTWNEKKFEKAIKVLEAAKEAALEKNNPDNVFELGKQFFLMSPKSAGGGVTYKYIFEGNGMTFKVHGNPQGDIQPVRIRYNAEGLIGRDLFKKHGEALKILRKMGFDVTEEKISRVDLQVMIYRPVDEFMRAIYERRIVCTARKWHIDGEGFNGYPQTFRLGGNIQVCLYDKRAEMFAMMKKNPVKFSLMVQECFGEEWLTQEIPTTRIEFRLRREFLKDVGIDSMDDLLEKEAGLAYYCCHSWFRILAEPKKKGHTHEQETSELWREVQDAFEKWFPGVDGHREDVKRNKNKVLRCSEEHLIKQACGCLATAASMSLGVADSAGESLVYALGKIREQASQIFVRSVERARELCVKTNLVAFDDPVMALDLDASLKRAWRPVSQSKMRFCHD